jgi:hypothetical protein
MGYETFYLKICIVALARASRVVPTMPESGRMTSDAENIISRSSTYELLG